MVSELFDPDAWRAVPGFEDLTDITYHRAVDQGTVRVAFDRPEIRNAFRPQTVDELYRVLDHARQSGDVGCVLLTGNGPSPRDGGWAFCSGGDQRIRGKDGYRYAEGDTAESDRPGPHRPAPHPRGAAPHPVHAQGRDLRRARVGRRRWPQPPRRVRPDPRRAEEHARFKQTDADVASFDGGFGSAYLARQVGQKFAREIFFLGGELHRRADAPHGHGERGRAPRRPRAGRPRVGSRRSTARARPPSGC